VIPEQLWQFMLMLIAPFAQFDRYRRPDGMAVSPDPSEERGRPRTKTLDGSPDRDVSMDRSRNVPSWLEGESSYLRIAMPSLTHNSDKPIRRSSAAPTSGCTIIDTDPIRATSGATQSVAGCVVGSWWS